MLYAQRMAMGKRPLSLGVRGSSQASVNTRAIITGQLAFTGSVLYVLLAFAVLTSSNPGPLSYLGAGVILLATASAIVFPIPGHPRDWMPVLMLVNLVGVGIMQLAMPQMLACLLWVFPIGWLATMRRVRFVIGGLAISFSFLAFGLLSSENELPFQALAAAVVVPLLLVMTSIAIYTVSNRARAQRDSQRRQARLLAQALSQAKAHELLLEEIIEAVSFGIVVVNSDGEVTMTNEAQRGFERLRVSPLDIYAADGFTRLDPGEQPLDLALNGEELDRVIVWFGPPEHERVALSVSSVNIIGGVHPTNGVLLLYQDVTAEINAIRARDDLIGSLSHELRNPLTSVVGYIGLALEEDLPENARRRLGIAERNAERLMQLITRIVEAANTEAGDLSIRQTPTDLVAIVCEAMEDQQVRARESGIRLEVDAPQELIVDIDGERIRQALDNLIANAIKYNRDGGKVGIQLRANGELATLSVHDSGVGISPDELPFVFDRLFRSERMRNSTVHGNGLGLYFSRQIIRLHGGEIELSSVPGEGTTVTVELPLKQGVGSTTIDQASRAEG